MKASGKAGRRDELLLQLAEHARRMRIHVIRMTTHAGSGHVTSAFSAADMVATLYFAEMRYDPKKIEDPARDRFILSKGHAAPILYAALHEAGVFDEATMMSLRQPGSLLQGHPWCRTPGVDATSGSLGIGLSQAIGRAIGARMRGGPSRIYAMISDGECDEGETWEAALAAAHYRTDNLCVFLDRNNAQVDGPTDRVMNLEPLPDKWRAFGWRVEEINGHDFSEILDYLQRSKEHKERPSIAIARTQKGRGVSFVEEGNRYRHASVLDPAAAEQAIAELKKHRITREKR